MKKIKGGALRLGNKIGVTAPASPMHSLDEITGETSTLAKWGYSIVLGKTVTPMDSDMAGADIFRQADLEGLWQNDEISAIWCLRGGYGSIRLLPQLWYDLFRKKPKIMIGFSDITALEMALWSQVRLVTFHGPVLTRLKGEFTMNQTFKTLRGENSVELEWPSGSRDSYVPIRSGKVQGIILGGNLSIIAALTGTRFLPNLEGAIVFLEEVGEPPYRIDRMLTQLIISGILPSAAGVIVGRCIPLPQRDENELIEIFTERLRTLKCPAAYGFPIGHIANQWTIPQGVLAEVDIDRGSLVLLEKPVE